MNVNGLTDRGVKRSNNEDYFIVNEALKLYIVADGMGGYKAGEVAAEIAAKTISNEIERRIHENTFEFQTQIDEILAIANQSILDYVEENPACRGMGTTIVVVWIDNETLHVANVGDSRCYALSDNELIQLTKDHSLVAELVKIGSISIEEAEQHPDKNIITSALGVEPKFDLFKQAFAIKKYAYLLICSDGLTNMVSSEEILRIFKTAEFNVIPAKLIECANNNGGKDNITVICVDIKGGRI